MRTLRIYVLLDDIYEAQVTKKKYYMTIEKHRKQIIIMCT